jgi:hypothetical protein
MKVFYSLMEKLSLLVSAGWTLLLAGDEILLYGGFLPVALQ